MLQVVDRIKNVIISIMKSLVKILLMCIDPVKEDIIALTDKTMHYEMH